MKPQKYGKPGTSKNRSLLSTSLTHNHLYDLIAVQKVRKCALNFAFLCVRLFTQSFHFISSFPDPLPFLSIVAIFRIFFFFASLCWKRLAVDSWFSTKSSLNFIKIFYRRKLMQSKLGDKMWNLFMCCSK